MLGQPGMSGMAPQHARTANQSGAPAGGAPDMEALVEKLAARLQETPDDLKGWTLLGRSYWELGRFTDAAAAYARAIELNGDDASLLVGYGEAMTIASDGMVTPPAQAAFKRAQALDAKHTGARFYLALAEQQAGRPQYAYNGWLELARDLETGSPAWRAVVDRLQAVANELGMDLAADLPAIKEAAAMESQRPAASGPTRADVEAAQDMSAEDRQEFIRSMVARLADRLEENPDDFDGWLRLGRAYGVLGEHDKSGDAYARAAALRPDNPAPLQMLVTARLQSVQPGEMPPEPALKALRQLLALQPENSRALWYLGLDDARSGRRAEAIAKWEKLRDQLPEGSEQRKNLDAGIAELNNSK
jgi:cytochrome c-type biogenesis protein CcmH